MHFFRWLPLLLCFALAVSAKEVAYIHGDVAPDGSIPSGAQAPYDQMLLNDSGNTGLTSFKSLVESQSGYSISQFYDANTSLTAAWLDQFDVVIFGLHQKLWSNVEKQALDAWLRGGGGMLIYSDSASGGLFSVVGIRNPVGQNATNNLISDYGMQVTVDQGGGTRAYITDAGSQNPIVWDQPQFEGEGVSPVAVDPNGGAQVLIPLRPANRVGGNGTLNIDERNITIANPDYAAMALRRVGEGHIIALFDRQPMWNNGPGSDIDKRDNREILRRTVRYLARDYGNSKEWFQFRIASRNLPLQVSWRQWRGGNGEAGKNYVARNTLFQLEHSTDLVAGVWRHDSTLVAAVGNAVDNGDETETVTASLAEPATDTRLLFARLALRPEANGSQTIVVDAGQDRTISQSGRVALEGRVTGGSGSLTSTWSKRSGPGDVVFAATNNRATTATFNQPGSYQLRLLASDGFTSSEDLITVRVVEDAKVVKAVNCGNVNSGFTGANGFVYEADSLFAGGWVDDFPQSISGTEDDGLYAFARSGFQNYTLPLPNGNYTVYLQFAELFFSTANRRVFDLSLEGNLVLDNLDIVAVSQGKGVAYDQTFSTTVSDGNLVINTNASVNNSLLNAFVIIRE